MANIFFNTKFPGLSLEYINGVDSFLDCSYIRGKSQGLEILCPCTKCRNCIWATRNVVYEHLMVKGFVKGYRIWIHHGEEIPCRTNRSDVEMTNLEMILMDYCMRHLEMW